MARLSTYCNKEALTCGVILIPALVGSPYPLQDVHSRLAAIFQAAGLPVFDLAVLPDHDDLRSLWVAKDDSHPNAEAHAIYGRALAPWVSGLLLYTAP